MSSCGAAMLAKRRSWLYLGGTLSSAISVMMVMRLGTWFFGGRALVFQVSSRAPLPQPRGQREWQVSALCGSCMPA